MKTIILAAGAGSRMKSNLPKALQPCADAAMIDYVLAAGIAERTVVLGHAGEQVAEYLAANYGADNDDGDGADGAADGGVRGYLERAGSPLTQPVRTHWQDMSHKGSAAALFGMEFSPDEDYLLLNCDMPLITHALCERLAASSADVAIAAFEASEPGSYGRVICREGAFVRIVEAKDASANELACRLCNGGVYKIRGWVLKELLPQITAQNAAAEYYLTDICKLALAAGASVQIVRASEAELAGVNDRAQLAAAEEAMQRKINDFWRKEGHLIAPSAVISARAELVNGCEIAHGAVIKGRCVLDGAKVLENCVIEASRVQNSSIGPLARLRPGCCVAASRVGNFVECKAAILRGVKAGHHAYLGDCEVGEGVNIGCGTIICNYDGERKHRTSIGAGAFVGSNVNIIAPAALPAGCFIAAGSTITGRDAAALGEGERFIARSRGGKF